MRDILVSFAQLAATIMLLITLAVSTAALSQWTDPDSNDKTDAAQLSLSEMRP